MRYPGVRELLERHRLAPKKAWGQNFLREPLVLDRIADVAEVGEGDRVVELGAGLGHLTACLAETGAEVVAVERDRDLVPVLEETFASAPTVRVVAADAKTVDLQSLRGDGSPLVVVGNLPYHLTSPILFHLLEARGHLARIVVMIQKEVAERLAAGPGSKAYGVLSVRFQLWAKVELAFDVPPTAFVPPPKVTSTVVRLDLRAAPLADPGDPDVFRRVVAAAFGQRRKTLNNALKSLVPDAEARRAVLAEAGIDAGARAETVPVTGFAALSRAVLASGVGGGEG